MRKRRNHKTKDDKPLVAQPEVEVVDQAPSIDHDEDEFSNGKEKDPLEAIYHEGKEGPVDMTRLERKKLSRGAIVVMVIAGLLLMAGAGIAGFFVFNPNIRSVNQSQNEAQISIIPPASIISGDDLAMTINVENRTNIDWIGADVALQLPDGWTFVKSEPESIGEFHNAWSLGPIEARKAQAIRLTGQLIGEIGAEKTLEVTLVYTPENFRSEFTKTATETLRITSSILHLEIDGPDQAAKDQEVSYRVTLENRSPSPLLGVKVMAKLPKDLTLTVLDPETEDQKPQWIFDRLNAGEQKKILLRGNLSGSSGDQKKLTIQAGILDDRQGFKLQQESEKVTRLFHPELQLRLTVNGTESDSIVKLSDLIRYELKYENVSDLELKDVRLILEIDERSEKGNVALLQWSKATGLRLDQIKDGKVSWDSADQKELAMIKPKAKGAFSLTVPLKAQLDGEEGSATNLRLDHAANVASFDVEGFEKINVQLKSVHQSTKIATALAIAGEARAFSESGDRLGLGPLPPKAGESTTYRITWRLTNTANALSDVVVATTLPSSISVTGEPQTSVGSIAVDRGHQTVTWKIPLVEALRGSALPALEARFDVTVTPAASDVGKVMTLIHPTAAAGRDAFTSEKTIAEAPLITTELANDPLAAGKGIVAP